MNQKVSAATIAPEFSDQSTYAAGSYVLKNGVLYRFTADHTGSWTGTDAVEVTVGEETTDLKADLNLLNIEQPTVFYAEKNVSVKSDGGLAYSNSAYRGRTDIFSPYSRYIRIEGTDTITYGVHGHDGSKWVSNIGKGSNLIDTEGYGLLIIQAISTSTVTSEDAPRVFYGVERLNEEITKAEIALDDADFTYGYYKNRDIASSTARICVKRMYVAKKGDIVRYTNPTLKIAIAMYLASGDLVSGATGWLSESNEQREYICEYDGYVFVQFQKDGSTQTDPTDYAGNTVTIINTLCGHVNLIKNSDVSKIMPSGDKIVAFLGDSITAGSGTNKAYHMYLHDRFGWTCKNYGYGGSGYAYSNPKISGRMATGQSGIGVAITASNQILPNDFLSRIATVDTNIDALVIFGGTNDWGQGDTVTAEAFETAVDNVLTYAQSNFGRIPIIVLLPIHRKNDTTLNGAGKTLSEYADIIIDVCRKHGVICIDTFGESGLYPDNADNETLFYVRDDTNVSDGVHPNHYAHKNISNLCALTMIEKMY